MVAASARPAYRRSAYAMHGLSWIGQILYGLRNPPRLELLEEWTIELHGLIIVVPKGFITDGASIPRLLWWLISPFGPLLEGAILHDFAYQHGYLLARYSIVQPYNRRSFAMRRRYPDIFSDTIPVYIDQQRSFFDLLLRYITIELNGASLQAYVAYVALRPFGGLAWKRYRRRGPAAYNSNSLFLPGVTL